MITDPMRNTLYFWAFNDPEGLVICNAIFSSFFRSFALKAIPGWSTTQQTPMGSGPTYGTVTTTTTEDSNFDEDVTPDEGVKSSFVSIG